MDESVLRALEFPAILTLLRERTQTPPGSAAAAALRPATDAAKVRSDSELTVEGARYLSERGALPFGTVADPEPILARLSVEASLLTPLEILDLLGFMKSGRAVKSAITEVRSGFPRMWEAARDLPDLGNLVRFLDGRIATTGEFEDHASDDLHAIRREIQRRNERLASLLREITSRPEVAHALQDDFVSIRSERHVVPIRIESRASLQGIVHGVSGSGATVFVEPMETVDLNNEIVTLRDRESAEIKRLLREYGDLLRGRLAELRSLSERLGRIDLIMARAALGRDMRGVPADPGGEDGLELSAARHPLLEASLGDRGSTMVPLDLALDPGTRVLVISGPNTGGKTVALKTVGLLALMRQSGCLLPAHRVRLPIYRGVFIDIGDGQSIADHMSTFSARIRTAAAISRDLRAPALVLLDEVGTGTDPEEGVALGVSLIDHYRSAGATVLATTHMEAFKAYAATTTGCANAAMEFDETTLLPTYRLLPGIPGRSGAFEVAARIGLPESILADARSRSGSSGRMVEDYLRRLQEQSIELEERLRLLDDERARLVADRSAFEAERAERERGRREAFSTEIELALRNIREEGERYLKGLKDDGARARGRRREGRLASRLHAEARRIVRRVRPESRAGERAGETLRAGSRVRIEGLGQEGIIESIRGDRVDVRVRGKRLTVARGECAPEPSSAGAPGERRRSLPRGVTVQRRAGGGTAPSGELHLRGLRVEEALALVDKFLDDSCVENLSPVRLIHGLGTGRLKKAIAELLSGHPHVESFASAPPDEGGVGVTLVHLRL